MGEDRERIVDRFIRYARIETTSRIESDERPTSEGQRTLASLVRTELEPLGLDLLGLSDGSLLVRMPASPGLEGAVSAAFAAHLDTAPIERGKAEPVLRVVEPRHLAAGGLSFGEATIGADRLAGLEGKAILTSDGTSLLGGDDKAGVAALVAAIERISEDGLPHGPLCVWFCTDEEVGRLDGACLPAGVAEGWDILWTVDGEALDLVCAECADIFIVKLRFKGRAAHVALDGRSVRPAHYAAAELIAGLSAFPGPFESAEGSMEPFVYATKVEGNAAEARTWVNVRAFSLDRARGLSEEVVASARKAAAKFGVELESEIVPTCVNIAHGIERRRELLDDALEALRRRGYPPTIVRTRGGTDGGMLNLRYPELPAPDLGTGSRCIHSKAEFLVIEELEALRDVLLDIVAAYAARRSA